MSRHITKDEWDHLEWLHVYGQYSYHSEATLRGTRAGLQSLREAIDAALKSGRAEATVMASDGEGYNVEVVCVSTHAELGSPEYIFEKSYQILSEEAERARELGLRDPFGKYVRIDDPRWAERIAAVRRGEYSDEEPPRTETAQEQPHYPSSSENETGVKEGTKVD